MTSEHEAKIRELVHSIVKGEAQLIERMILLRTEKWLNFVIDEIRIKRKEDGRA